MKFIGVLVGLLFLGVAQAETVVVKKLETKESIRDEYCRISTGSDSVGCGMQWNEKRLDVVYLPLYLAQKIANHLVSAYNKKYFFNLNKKDMFHGHLVARGPRTLYKSPEDYFSDVQLILYHSQEYLNNWESIIGNDPFVPHEQQRSFVGYFDNNPEVVPAIDLINRSLYTPPYQMKDLRMYKVGGTIYVSELNQSVQASLHEYDLSSRLSLFIQSDSAETKQCKIFQQIYILEDTNGRFVSPDGKRFDITMYCKYQEIYNGA